jgi:hypothetical protein
MVSCLWAQNDFASSLPFDDHLRPCDPPTLRPSDPLRRSTASTAHRMKQPVANSALFAASGRAASPSFRSTSSSPLLSSALTSWPPTRSSGISLFTTHALLPLHLVLSSPLCSQRLLHPLSPYVPPLPFPLPPFTGSFEAAHTIPPFGSRTMASVRSKRNPKSTPSSFSSPTGSRERRFSTYLRITFVSFALLSGLVLVSGSADGEGRGNIHFCRPIGSSLSSS